MKATHLIDQLKTAQQMWRYFGTDWMRFRVGYALRLRTGSVRRSLPATSWEAQPLARFLGDAKQSPAEQLAARRDREVPRFFFASGDRSQYAAMATEWDDNTNNPVAAADHLLAGQMRFFSHTRVDTGWPPQWHRNAYTGQVLPDDVHWSQIDEYGFGDIKLVWEPSRFSFVFTLVRAYWRSGDERYAEAFWQSVEDWRTHNPPQTGPNWKCGQETSLRVLAWCFGLYGFLDATATTPERLALLMQLCAVSAERVENNLAYALSQRNNHGISEATGLLTIGLVFPELRNAPHWARRGHDLLEQLALDLIYSDGAFVQHSVNYHRLMLHDYLWAIRLGDVAGRPFSTAMRARVAQASRFLYQLQDEVSGRVPAYGAIDGAQLLQLTNCDFLDYRPVLQTASIVLEGHRRYIPGAWDEESFWLCGAGAIAAPLKPEARADFSAEIGGYYVLRSATGFAATRCATYRDRPSQADMLHVDLWWKGQNIAVDAGSFAYNAPPPWDGGLGGTAVHNTVTVNGRDQMTKKGRFLWLPWLRSRVIATARDPAGSFAYWEGEHDGYTHLEHPVRHRRAILRAGPDLWVIADLLQGSGLGKVRLHWLLNDFPSEWSAVDRTLALLTPAGPYYLHMPACGDNLQSSIVRANTRTVRGWQAPYYQDRLPAISLAVEQSADRSQSGSTNMMFYSVFSSSAPISLVSSETLFLQAGKRNLSIFLSNDAESPMAAGIALDGNFHPIP